MALLKWIPYKELLFLQERMRRVFEETIAKYMGIDIPSGAAWSPPADIYETQSKVILKVELPGIDIEDVEIEVKDSFLVVKGDKRQRVTTNEYYHRMECSYGAFQRIFSLPVVIDRTQIQATLSDGVLTIVVPKIEKEKLIHVKVEAK